MGYILILAEKPAAARTLGRLLLKAPKEESDLVIRGRLPDGQMAVVSAFNGHVLAQQTPEEYDVRWASPWRLAALPIFPPDSNWRLKPIHPPFLRRIASLMEGASEIINCCDAAREGELIFWETLRYLGWHPSQVKTTRMWWTEPVRNATQEAFRRRRKITEKKFVRMATAADARAKADWIIGFNGTRYLTKTIPAYGALGNPVYPVGRVKTPTLNLVEKRLGEIEQFISRTFYRLSCEFFSEKGNYFAYVLAPEDLRFGFDDERFKNYADAAAYLREIATSIAEWKVYDNVEPVLEYAPPPFDLTDLQRTAVRCFGWSPKKTLRLAQTLYSTDAAISYPRTNNSRIPLALKPEVEAIHHRLWQEYALPTYEKLAEVPYVFDPHFFKDEKPEHFAIIPTGEIPKRTDPAGTIKETWLLWDLIVRRFLMALTDPAQIDASARILEFTSSDESLTARARLKAAPVVFPGWLKAEDALGNAGSQRRSLKEREKITWPPSAASARLVGIKIFDGYTTPPEYYTEDTLLAEMEKFNLGTVATRADVIDELFEDTYLERRENGHLFPTGRASYHLSILQNYGAKALTDPDLTASWETYFQKIEDGEPNIADTNAFIRNVLDEITNIGLALQRLPRGADLVVCPRSFHVVRDSSDETGPIYIFDGYPKTRFPVTYYGRFMKKTEWRQILAAKRAFFGPFRFFSNRTGAPFVAYVRHVRRENKFEFKFSRNRDEPAIE